MKKLLRKKSVFFILLLLVVLVVSSSFAYLYSEVIFPNRFKTMTYKVTLQEEFYNTWGTKKVTIKNEEETGTPIVLRVNYNETWSKTVDDVLLILDNNINGENAVTKNWTSDFLNDFVKGDDGWYYYKKVLDSKESVQILESIALKEDLVNSSLDAFRYRTYNYELSFNYEAIQASEAAVADIWNKNITISGSDVTW